MLLCLLIRSVYVEHKSSSNSFTTDNSWTILSSIERTIRSKIEDVGLPLSQWNLHIYRGILTGYNDAFIISTEKKDELIAADPKSAEIIRPILRGRDIKRYSYSFADLWLIATFPSRHYNIDNYPAIKNHLLSYGKERLEQTGRKYIVNGVEIKARKKTNNKWFETQDSISYWNDFFKPKIVWGNLCLSAQFAFAEEGFFINAPSPMIVPGNKYILAVLNSRLGDWYIRQLGVTRNGGYFEYKPMFIEQLPIPTLSGEDQAVFVSLIDKILLSKANNEDSSGYESEIDNLVYKLYGLSEEEIMFIKNS